ncbi:sigma-70 family RNA polymerase sigma factor [Myxococcota bacterium]|nr:sigma-70 family RNA polymerase sigma factor [Myxococcota bacterium]
MDPSNKASLATKRDLDEEARLWNDVRSGVDQTTRCKIFEEHLDLTKRIAGRLYANRSDGLAEFDDYVHYGTVGLLEALDRYDPTRGASFSTFAGYRIRGAILNSIPKISERRSFHSYRKRVISERSKSLADSGLSESESFERAMNLTLGLALGALLEMANGDQREVDRKRSDPYECGQIERAKRIVVNALDNLPERESIVVRSHYFQAMDFTQIAGLLGLTKGRISQIHRSAMAHLKADLSLRWGVDDYY